MPDLSLLWKHKIFMLSGAVVTIKLTAGAIALGLILGVFLGIGRVSRGFFLKSFSGIYVQLFRGTPMLLQIFFIYFGVPQIYNVLTGNSMSPDPLFVGIIALGLNSGAYVAEIVRAGIQAVGQGQFEAGRSIGLSYKQTMRYIILPQAIKKIIPPLGNEAIILLKDSSLVSVIGTQELMYSAKVMGSRYYDYVQFLVGAGLIYLLFTFIISRLLAKVEDVLDYS
ncbi:MAG: polar amino acid ABC transporter permease [Gammaproteobacteria bacterium]|nr:MAG: polar amino acid ABC transporter permease [Deltaproteobacteria bacterium]PIE48135.1 MAG: polar amino acid ABC transporter permease [Gammaproteobacteria bacterium]